MPNIVEQYVQCLSIHIQQVPAPDIISEILLILYFAHTNFISVILIVNLCDCIMFNNHPINTTLQ